MSAKVGRPTKSKETIGLFRPLQLPVSKITSSPFIPKKAKRTFHDGKKLHRLVNMRNDVGYYYTKDLKEILEELKKDGFKNLKSEHLVLSMPQFCLKCDRRGNPSYGKDKIKSERDKNFKDNVLRFRLWYTHHAEKKPCYVGYWNGGVKLAKGIPLQKMGASYQSLLHLKENQIT